MIEDALTLSRRARGPAPGWCAFLALAWATFALTKGTAVLYLALLATSWTAVATWAVWLLGNALSLRLGQPTDSAAGKELRLRLTASNSSSLPLAITELRARLHSSEAALELAPLSACVVPAGGHAVLEWRTCVARRGSYLAEVSLELAVPGALVGWSVDAFPRSPRPLWIRPERWRLNFRGLETLARSHFDPGASLRVAADATEEFAGLRQWRPGESMRRVDWKSFARTGTIVLKEFKDSAFGEVLVALDTFVPEGAAGEARAWRLERAVGFVGALAARLCEAGYRVDVKTVGPAPIDESLAPRQKDHGPLARRLANLVPTRRPDDLRRLAGGGARKYGLTIVVSLDPRPSAGVAGFGRAIVIAPDRAARYRAGAAPHAGQSFYDDEARALAAPRKEPVADPPRASRAGSWSVAAACLAGAATADRLGAPGWIGAAAFTALFATAFAAECRRQNEGLVLSSDAASVSGETPTAGLDAARVGAITSTLAGEVHG